MKNNTRKLACKLHLGGQPSFQMWAAGALGLCVLELFTMYVTDRQTDRWMDNRNAYCPHPSGGRAVINNYS